MLEDDGSLQTSQTHPNSRSASAPRHTSREAVLPASPGGSAGGRLPARGLFAPQEDKVFVKGVVAYMQGRHQEAVDLFHNVSTRPTSNAHVSEEFFAALSLLALGRIAEAIAPLEVVVTSHISSWLDAGRHFRSRARDEEHLDRVCEWSRRTALRVSPAAPL